MTERTVPVDGGVLALDLDGGEGDPVLAVHGVSSQRKLWNWLRTEAPEIPLVAPDLRGRAGSAGLPGPSSIHRHAADLVAVLDALGLDAVDVCGMSMGGFVAVELAAAWPERVRRLVLVDGGLPMAVPAGLTPESVPAAFAGALGRLGRRWPDIATYGASFLSPASLLDPGDPRLIDYLVHDLDETGRVRLDGDALVADATDVFFGPSRWRELTVPVELLAAQWSIGAGSAPAYTDEALAGFTEVLPDLVTRRLPYVDHEASIMTLPGAKGVAEALRRGR